MRLEFTYKGGNVLEQLKQELNIFEHNSYGKEYYTIIDNIKYEIVDYGFNKDNDNKIFATLVNA